MTLPTGTRKQGFTLIEMAVVVAIIFFLAGALILIVPAIERRSMVHRAKGDIQRLEAALDLHKEIRGWYPPDNIAHFKNYDSTEGDQQTDPATSPTPWITKGKAPSTNYNSRPRPENAAGFTAEEISNMLMVHFLTAAKEKQVFVEFGAGELKEVGLWRTAASSAAEKRRQLDPAYSYLSRSQSFQGKPDNQSRRAYMFLDPWGKPYVYDNNVGLPANDLFDAYNEITPPSGSSGRLIRGRWDSDASSQSDPSLWFDGLPNNNPTFDLYSFGPNKKTALTSEAQGNEIDDDDNGTADGASTSSLNYQDAEWDDALYNGKEHLTDDSVADDINNFKSGQ